MHSRSLTGPAIHRSAENNQMRFKNGLREREWHLEHCAGFQALTMDMAMCDSIEFKLRTTAAGSASLASDRHAQTASEEKHESALG